jgi:outer membrane protein OmpA-like peptidoglycan-associated protein
MKRILLTLVAIVGLGIIATAQPTAADLRKSVISSTGADNSVSVYKDGLLYAKDGKLQVTKVQGNDLSAPEAIKGISYSGERETYAYDAKTETLYAVVSKSKQTSIKAGNINVVPSEAALQALKGRGDDFESRTSLTYWNWQFGKGEGKAVIEYSAKQPSLTADGKKLYFASNLSGGYGGYDIWYLNRNADGTWSEPVNAGNNINTASNEEYPFLFEDILLFSSDRGGNYDLYSLTGTSVKKLTELNSGADDINAVVSGKTGLLVSNRDGNDDIFLFNADYLKPAPAPAPKPEPKVEPKPEPKQEPKVEPKPLPKEEQAVVETAFKNLTFETGKAVIKNGKSDLDKLAEILNKYPNAKVTLSGHTDNTGSDAINDKLSQNRADAVKTYLVGKGVKSTQITATGYGSKQPVAPNTTAGGRATNRRVEIDVKI